MEATCRGLVSPFHSLLQATLAEWQSTLRRACPVRELQNVWNVYCLRNVPPHYCYRALYYAFAPAGSAAQLYLQEQADEGNDAGGIL